MENKEQEAPAEANRDDAKNKESEESRRQKHDADSSNEDFNDMLQKEKLIDPGNEHHHHTDADSGDASGIVGPEPGKS